MAASAATASSSPGLSPNYAVICSFLERYGALLDLPEFTFPQLERYLQDTSSGWNIQPSRRLNHHGTALAALAGDVSWPCVIVCFSPLFLHSNMVSPPCITALWAVKRFCVSFDH